MKAVTLLLLALLLVAGCSTQRPVLIPHGNAPGDVAVSQANMQEAILAALEAKGWTATQVSPTDIRATINVRNRHRASINISYSPLDYQIQYVSSGGLDYADGQIHRNYNRWVQGLSDAILAHLHGARATTSVQ